MSTSETIPEDRPYVSWVGSVVFGFAFLMHCMIVRFWSMHRCLLVG
jgi:hypothetical protein